MTFHFREPIDPKNPTDISDPPPNYWEQIDAHDYRKALFGFPDALFVECVEWEKRELERIS